MYMKESVYTLEVWSLYDGDIYNLLKHINSRWQIIYVYIKHNGNESMKIIVVFRSCIFSIRGSTFTIFFIVIEHYPCSKI